MISTSLRNEPMLSYAAGSPERTDIRAALDAHAGQVIDIPLVINGRRHAGGGTLPLHAPHAHRRQLAAVSQADVGDIAQAIVAATTAQRAWAAMDFESRAAIFLRAADLLAGPWRQRLNAATMLGQSKTVVQAEIDSACELIDFLRFNVAFARTLLAHQPHSPDGMRNALDYRPLEGFVYAVTPFNFTAIAGNLPCAPALLGNTVIWKPAFTASLSNYLFMELLEAAGLPPGVINFVPGSAAAVSDTVLASRDFAGLHFTGSTEVFDALWQQVARRLPQYRSYPRLVGETGGKDFILAHASADAEAVAVALLRGAFEYQGQKCSAASRAYLPASLWPRIKERLLDDLATLRMGDVEDFGNFMGAVIDLKAFDRVSGYIAGAQTAGHQVLAGGQCNDRDGYFIAPTVIEVSDPKAVTMREEIFGPVLSLIVYPDTAWETMVAEVDDTSPYALTGAVFATDRQAIAYASAHLRASAGNFYINDKPTGAVVGQQPFGGARRSGTNDKAGSVLNLQRWTSPRTIKETWVPATDYRYPHMA
ncbi:L-glutamate gamma-semialdehyde dehydrogenase [Pigmentiphaga litoralis]|uniref:L-glutamate gamma-semialdehyde dehydrogenase n=1 Tax=Pigmentiphaga litoralis TaxID=516702 RepID=A0A7Y9J0L5_9BURK|nr:L-glutamate gamma-semialdehyde dehydrogenase [Pigmentiphaga litoralis]NYE26444.1 1-pyrroline-5-carboxylate dehydrogenase [Pigmentiphaga litoralis]NYE85564.1 1-pyrroline-5-carboxylate dehydrogenase [Pigmentiphaga litoralis]